MHNPCNFDKYITDDGGASLCKIDGNVRTLTKLPTVDELIVGGRLEIMTAETMIPKKIHISGDLVIIDSCIFHYRDVDDDMTGIVINDTLMWACDHALPYDLTVNGRVEIISSLCSVLPDKLHVCGNLMIISSAIKSLPNDIMVSGRIIVRPEQIPHKELVLHKLRGLKIYIVGNE